MAATQKQKDAFTTLYASDGFINPTTSDVGIFRQKFSDQLKDLYVDFLGFGELGTFVTTFGIFAVLESTFVDTTNWTDNHFLPGGSGQQKVNDHKGMANGAGIMLEELEYLPGYPYGSGSPLTKFNSTWFEDIIGSLTGTFDPYYIDMELAHNELETYSTTEYNNFVNVVQAISDAWVLEKAGSPAPEYADLLLIIDGSSVGVDLLNLQAASVALITHPSVLRDPLSILNGNDILIQEQLTREQWWWENLPSDYNYQRLINISAAGGISLSIRNEKAVPSLNNIISKVGTPDVVAALNEIL